MKNIFWTITLTMFFLPLKLNAQELTDFNNQWNIVSYPTEGQPSPRSYSYKIGESEIIDGILYKKLLYSNDSLSLDWSAGNRYIRQDSTGKVFYRNSSIEDLIYDFSLEMNDTFFIEYNCPNVVINIDSINLNNGEIRKRWELENLFTGQKSFWLDNIGSNLGLISYYFSYCSTDYSEELLCFYSESELLYPQSPPSCFITPVKNEKLSKIKIYPNPILSKFVIINNREGFAERVRILNNTGKIIYSVLLDQGENNLEIEFLPSGIYYFQFLDENGFSFSKKIIKK